MFSVTPFFYPSDPRCLDYLAVLSEQFIVLISESIFLIINDYPLPYIRVNSIVFLLYDRNLNIVH